jgi:hypothetical protein
MPFCLLLLLLCLSTACQATQLRVCADNRNVPPLSFIGGMGEAQYLLAQAAGNLQLRLSISYLPQLRCLKEVAARNFDALLTSSPNPLTEPLLAFPLDRTGQPDRSRAYMVMPVVAFRLKGAQSSWDGAQFGHLRKPVLYEKGVPTVQLFMQKSGVPAQGSAHTPQQMMEMILAGRADIGVALEPAIRYALQQHDPQQQFEVIEPPLFKAPVFLGIGKHFAATHAVLAEQLWNEIRSIRASPQWLRIRDQVQHNRLPAEATFP